MSRTACAAAAAADTFQPTPSGAQLAVVEPFEYLRLTIDRRDPELCSWERVQVAGA